MDAVLRHDFATRELPGHGLKAVARHFGLAGPDREHIRGDQIHEVYRRDPERVRRYAAADVEEVAGLARLLGGAAFALARMAPRRYERLADAGAATGVIDPLLVRAYLRAGTALPAHQPGDGTPHSGAALHLFASGVARRVVKADVASLYPSLMRAYRIGPARDRLGALLALVDRLVERRLAAKGAARAPRPPGSAERYTHEAMSAAMKLVVNSAYGYLAAGGGLTRFADVHAANEVTRRGREALDLMCRELARARRHAARGRHRRRLLRRARDAGPRPTSAASSPRSPRCCRRSCSSSSTAATRRCCRTSRRTTRCSPTTARSSCAASRSARAAPSRSARRSCARALARLLAGDVAGVRDVYLGDGRRAAPPRAADLRRVVARAADARRRREYLAIRESRRELAYEALLASGRTSWSRRRARPRLSHRDRLRRRSSRIRTTTDGEPERADPRDYDVDHYVRVLRDTFAARLARAFTPDDFAAVFADPGPAVAVSGVAGDDPYCTHAEHLDGPTAHFTKARRHEDHERESSSFFVSSVSL